MAKTEERQEEETTSESEQVKLDRWLTSQFLGLGFSLSMADSLVAAGADWREAEHVLASNPPGGHTWVYFYLMPQPYES